MAERIHNSGLQIATTLYRLVENKIAPGTGIKVDHLNGQPFCPFLIDSIMENGPKGGPLIYGEIVEKLNNGPPFRLFYMAAALEKGQKRGPFK